MKIPHYIFRLDVKCASSEGIEILFDANIKITDIQVWDTKQSKEWCSIELKNVIREKNLFEKYNLVRLASLKANRTYNIRIIVDDPAGGKAIIFTRDGVQTKGQCLTGCLILLFLF